MKKLIIILLLAICINSVSAQQYKNEVYLGYLSIDNFKDGLGVTPNKIYFYAPNLYIDIPILAYYRHFKKGYSVKAEIIRNGSYYLPLKYPERVFNKDELVYRQYNLWQIGIEKNLLPYKRVQLLATTGIAKRTGFQWYYTPIAPVGWGFPPASKRIRDWGCWGGIKLKIYPIKHITLNAEVSYYTFSSKATNNQILANFGVCYAFNAKKPNFKWLAKVKSVLL